MLHLSFFFRLHRFSWIAVFVIALGVAAPTMAQTKLAFLAGVETYQRDGFDPLNYAEDDALELKIELDKLGFKTVAIVGEDATLAGLNRGLSSLYESSKKLKREDVVLVFLSGHGVQKLVRRSNAGKLVIEAEDGRFQIVERDKGGKLTKGAFIDKEDTIEKEEPYFCPIDAHKNDVSTMLNMNDLMERLKEDSSSSNNIVLLDACRESLDKGKGIDGSTIEALPNKLALFFASQSGRRSFESRKLEHGIFTHYLLEGLRGKAADEDNEITLQGLTSYVSKRVERDSPGLLDGKESEAQEPNLMGNLRGSLLLGKVADHRKTQPPTPPPSSSSGGTGMGASGSTITNSVGMKLVLIKSGSFLMGSPTTETDRADAEVQHRVTLSSDYYLGETEVTQGQWKLVMGNEPWKGQVYVQEGANFPATHVSWDDAVEFCKRLSEREGKRYRLPTEAEWEYACRGGTSTPYSFGDSATELARYDWFRKNAWDVEEKYAHEVKGKQANPFGLYDMHGNVIEWCLDWYTAYPNSAVNDPPGPTDGSSRVVRGGSWALSASYCRSAYRYGNAPDNRDGYLGFRVAVGR